MSPILLLKKLFVEPLKASHLKFFGYCILDGVDTKRNLGEFHISAARNHALDSWVAKEDYANAKQVGQKIKRLENGVFYKNDYVGKYGCF